MVEARTRCHDRRPNRQCLIMTARRRPGLRGAIIGLDAKPPGQHGDGMDEAPPAELGNVPPTEAQPIKKEENFFVFLIKLVLIVAVFRSFFFSPFNIPSESMLPNLV